MQFLRPLTDAGADRLQNADRVSVPDGFSQGNGRTAIVTDLPSAGEELDEGDGRISCIEWICVRFTLASLFSLSHCINILPGNPPPGFAWKLVRVWENCSLAQPSADGRGRDPKYCRHLVRRQILIIHNGSFAYRHVPSYSFITVLVLS